VGTIKAGRYKSLVVDGSGSGYLRTVAEYVHLNPVRAKLLRAEQALRRYRWSSYPVYLLPPRRRPGWLRVDRVLGELPGRRWRWKVLDRLPKSDPRKVALALGLGAETTLSVAWIAARLGLGTRQYATKLLYGARRQSEDVKS
jgi:putative transposase